MSRLVINTGILSTLKPKKKIRKRVIILELSAVTLLSSLTLLLPPLSSPLLPYSVSLSHFAPTKNIFLTHLLPSFLSTFPIPVISLSLLSSFLPSFRCITRSYQTFLPFLFFFRRLYLQELSHIHQTKDDHPSHIFFHSILYRSLMQYILTFITVMPIRLFSLFLCLVFTVLCFS